MPFKILVIFLCFISLNADQKEITQKISQNKTALESKKKKEAQINQKLQEIGNHINKQKEELETLENIIQESEKNISKNKQEYTTKEKLIKTLSNEQETLYQKRKNIELAIIDLVAKDISFAIIATSWTFILYILYIFVNYFKDIMTFSIKSKLSINSFNLSVGRSLYNSFIFSSNSLYKVASRFKNLCQYEFSFKC